MAWLSTTNNPVRRTRPLRLSGSGPRGMTLVLCPICRQLLAPAPPGWSALQTGLPAGWDCPYAHGLSTPPAVYDAARLAWLARDLALHPGSGQAPCGAADDPRAEAAREGTCPATGHDHDGP